MNEVEEILYSVFIITLLSFLFYPIIKGKELNPNGIPVKQADRTFGQFAGHHF